MAIGFGGVTNDPLNLGSSLGGVFGSLFGGVPQQAGVMEFTKGTLPWANNSGDAKKQPTVNSAFFRFIKEPNPNLWDKLVPYRLIVWDTANNKIVGGGTKLEKLTIEPLGNGTLKFTPLSAAWEFRLPITPQQLSITDAYSINTSATLRGILEEHSGVRFKNITIQGTFGVWPGRANVVTQPGTPSLLQSVFGGVISAVENVASQFTSIINNITNGSNAAKPKNIRPDNTNPSEMVNSASVNTIDKSEANGLGTGYYQTMMLTQFLEQYAEAKRNPANAAWRLVFDIPKQSQSFVVTPVGFTWNENVNKPMEISYNLQLKAWRRIDLQAKVTLDAYNVTPLTPGILQRILNTIQAAQNTAAAATNLIGAVRSDVDNVLNIVRQTGLFVKGLAGVAIAASDLPSQLASDCKSTISNFISTIEAATLTGPAATNPSVLSSVKSFKQLSAQNEGLSRTAISNGQLGQNAADSSSLNPTNTIFAKPLQYPLLLGQVPVSSLTLTNAQQDALQKEINTVNAFTVADLKNMRSEILNLTTQLSNSFGAGNPYYSKLFNKPSPSKRTEPMTLDEFDILSPFYDLVQSYDTLTSTNQLDNDQILNSMEYVNALAATSNIPFSISNSKIQVPVPFGLTIEEIAMRYLGDPQRWLEIATLNSLEEPFIDSNGFQYPLLSNAVGRNIVVGNRNDLRIGQTIYLYSSTQTPTARKIIDISNLSQTSFLLTLDGLSNLDVFKIADSAYLQAYLPNTVNEQNSIWVPSDIVSPAYDQISIPASVANVDLVGMSKVDLLLDATGDLALTNTGDFRLAAGITNIVQSLAIKFGTKLGTSLLNPDFGLGFKVGTMNSDVNAKDLYDQIVNMITADQRFQGVSDLQVQLNGPSLGLNIGVQMAGQNGIFPISFVMPS